MNGGAGSMAMPILGGVAGFALSGGNPMGAMAGASAGAAVGGGVQQMSAASAGADQAKVQMEAEKAQAAQRAADIRRQLAATIGQQRAVMASRGISDFGAGSTPAALGADSINAAGRDLSTGRFNLGQRLGALGFTRQQYGMQGTAAGIGMLGGVASAGMGYYDWKSRIGGPKLLSYGGNTYTGPQY